MHACMHAAAARNTLRRSLAAALPACGTRRFTACRTPPPGPSARAVQAGASAYALGRHATEQDAAAVDLLFSSVGFCIQVEEKQLDAVTGGRCCVQACCTRVPDPTR